jgi:hypothetical protein
MTMTSLRALAVSLPRRPRTRGSRRIAVQSWTATAVRSSPCEAIGARRGQGTHDPGLRGFSITDRSLTIAADEDAIACYMPYGTENAVQEPDTGDVVVPCASLQGLSILSCTRQRLGRGLLDPPARRASDRRVLGRHHARRDTLASSDKIVVDPSANTRSRRPSVRASRTRS